MDLSAIIVYIIAGLIIGALARLLVRGTGGMSIIVTIILGILGSLGGAWLYTALGGGETEGIDWIALLLGVIVAAILVAIYVAVTGRKNRDHV